MANELVRFAQTILLALMVAQFIHELRSVQQKLARE
jgi:hypothetical protein